MAKADTSLSSEAVRALTEAGEDRSPRRFKTLRTFVLHKPLGVFGVVIIIVLGLFAVFGPQIAPYDPGTRFQAAAKAATTESSADDVTCISQDCLQKAHGTAAQDIAKQGPSAKHWMGTDEGSRDIWTRILYGARRSLGVGVGSLVIGTFLGVLFGGLSGYFGGATDTITQRVMDALQAFPPILFLLLLTSVGQPNIKLITVGIGIVAMPQISRIARSTVLQVRALPFVEAAQVIGAPDRRVMLTHILPNIWAPVIVIFTIGVGAGILAEAALSFLGVAPVGISWGFITASGVGFITASPSEAIFGGLAITLAVLGFNLAGDALRDVLDPRLRAQ